MNADRSLLPAPRSAPDLQDDEFDVLLPGLATLAPASRRPGMLRERVLERIGRSARAGRELAIVRRGTAPVEQPAPGVRLHRLYEAGAASRRPGEPERVSLVELVPGAVWPGPRHGLRHEWLVLGGRATLAGAELAALDYRFAPPGHDDALVAGRTGALLYWREAAVGGGRAFTSHDEGGAWDDFAPGIRRRLLWTAGGEAAMLYHALPGAAVPAHVHGHDEECLMIEGDLFLDDLLLRRGDYQLAPAGSGHGGVATDTGAVVFAHGDLDLDLRPV